MLRFLTFIVGLVALATSCWSAGKQEIMGFTPEMSFDETQALISSKNFRSCFRVPAEYAQMINAFAISCDNMQFIFSSVFPGAPLLSIVVSFRGAAEMPSTSSLSDQFGNKQFQFFETPNGELYEWDLGNDKVLRYFAQRATLVLSNVKMIDKNSQLTKEAN